MKTMLPSILVAFIALFCSRKGVTSHEVVTSNLLRGTTVLEKYEGARTNNARNIDDQHAKAEQPQVLQSGVGVSDEVTSSIQALRVTRDYRYFVYEIKGMMIVVGKQGERSKTYDDFVKELPENDCRYGLIDIEYVTDSGINMRKTVFISWIPDAASVKTRMLYAWSKDALQSRPRGVSVVITAYDPFDLDFEKSILPLLKKSTNPLVPVNEIFGRE